MALIVRASPASQLQIRPAIVMGEARAASLRIAFARFERPGQIGRSSRPLGPGIVRHGWAGSCKRQDGYIDGISGAPGPLRCA